MCTHGTYNFQYNGKLVEFILNKTMLFFRYSMFLTCNNVKNYVCKIDVPTYTSLHDVIQMFLARDVIKSVLSKCIVVIRSRCVSFRSYNDVCYSFIGSSSIGNTCSTKNKLAYTLFKNCYVRFNFSSSFTLPLEPNFATQTFTFQHYTRISGSRIATLTFQES